MQLSPVSTTNSGSNFDSLGVAVDLHPFTGPFRLSAGLLANDNDLDCDEHAGRQHYRW